MLFDEVMREFEHIIIHTIMYEVDFGRMQGVQAIEKAKCIPVNKANIAITPLEVADANNKVIVANEVHLLTLELLIYLKDGGDDSDEGVMDPNWKANIYDW